VDDLLVQAQERFVTDRFIPLSDRKVLMIRIDSLRATIPQPAAPAAKKSERDGSVLLATFFSLFGVVATAAGALSLGWQVRRDRKARIQETVDTRMEEVKTEIQQALEFEKLVQETLVKLSREGLIELREGGRSGIGDFFISTRRGLSFYVEVKHSRTGVLHLSAVRNTLALLQAADAPIILVSNAQLSNEVVNILGKLSHSEHGPPLFVIVATTQAELEAHLGAFVQPPQ